MLQGDPVVVDAVELAGWTPTHSPTQGVIEWQRAPSRTLASGSVLPPSNAASASGSTQRYASHPSEQYPFVAGLKIRIDVGDAPQYHKN